MTLYVIMQAFFPDINPPAWMTCSLHKWSFFLPLHPPQRKESLQRQCHHLSSLEFGFPKGFSEVHCLKRWFNEESFAMNCKHHPFLYKIECSEGISWLWGFWFTTVHCHQVGYAGPHVAEYCGRWAATTGRKVRCHNFFWKVLLSFDYQTTCNYTRQYHRVKWNIVLLWEKNP